MDLRFGTWNVRRIYRTGSHRRVEEEIKWILERQDGMVWTGSIWLRIGTGGGFL
jgi:hypothetical protein